MQELRELPARVAGVELQILQLRGEMQEAFSATRAVLGGKVEGLRVEMHGIRDELRTEIHGFRDELRAETHGIRDELRAEIHGIRDDLRTEIHEVRDELRADMQGVRDDLLAEIRDGDRETQNFMKVLFEHHQSNLKTIGEGTPKRKR